MELTSLRRKRLHLGAFHLRGRKRGRGLGGCESAPAPRWRAGAEQSCRRRSTRVGMYDTTALLYARVFPGGVGPESHETVPTCGPPRQVAGEVGGRDAGTKRRIKVALVGYWKQQWFCLHASHADMAAVLSNATTRPPLASPSISMHSDQPVKLENALV